jgi:hypothetical protein
MTRRWLLGAGWLLLLLSISTMFAQGGGAPNDPVSGNWGMDGQTFFELKFDGTRSVSGTAIWRHGGSDEQRTAIKIGTFDPQSGALKLTGEVKRPDGAVVPFVIEGKVENNTVAGTFDVGGDKGDFRFTRQ